MNDLKTTNKLLLILAIPVVFYLLKILSFIFIPLVAAMFIALLFLPLMRWLSKKKVSKTFSILIVVCVMVIGIFATFELVKISSQEILSADTELVDKAEVKMNKLIASFEEFAGITRDSEDDALSYYLKGNDAIDFGGAFNVLKSTLSMSVMTIFFTILLLSESINFQQLMHSTILKTRHSSVKTFRKIEKDIIKFVIVKFVISFFTGVGFTIACLAFDVSFPIFWGLFAFIINFIQMIGSLISIAALSVFALVEIDSTGTLLFFVLSITAVQAIMGGVLEPVFMGKTFSINVITVLVMLSLWGMIWGIPGLIMSIPITVFIKIILEQFPKTRVIASLMAGAEPKVKLPKKKVVTAE